MSCGEEVPTVGASVNAHSRTEVTTVLDQAKRVHVDGLLRGVGLHELVKVEAFDSLVPPTLGRLEPAQPNQGIVPWI